MDSEGLSVDGTETFFRDNEELEIEVNSPVVGQEIINIGDVYQSIEAAYKSYKAYAGQKGFAVRKSGEKHLRDGTTITYKRFVCSKEGETKEKIMTVDEGSSASTSTRNTGMRRTGCNARLCIYRQAHDGSYRVTIFDDDHNHKMTSPKSRHCLKSNRTVTTEMLAILNDLDKAGIPKNLQTRLLVEQSKQGFQSLGCLPKDIENARAAEKKLLLGHDADSMLIYFENKKKNNPHFCYTVLCDENNTLKHCFWSDAHSRLAYTHFGDCCVMDSTYKTNKYHMIFATIAGVNHHRQTIVFGSALLTGESAEVYKWFFDTWLRSMPGAIPPKIIITDQDHGIRIAVSDVLPTTFHRLCMWHIIMKFDTKLSKEQMKLYYDRFSSIIYNSKKREDFDKGWTSLVEEAGGLRGTPWFREIFEVRDKWVPAYCKHVFSAGMRSSQRIESSHSFFKQYVNENNSLLDFIIKFDSALESQRSHEITADHVDVDQQQRSCTYIKFEQEMGQIYTKANFNIFQEELRRSLEYLKFTEMSSNAGQVVYRVVKEENLHWEELTYDKSSKLATCECKKFENEGIPCRHLIFLYRRLEEARLPEYYVLERWKKDSKTNRMLAATNEIHTDERGIIQRNFRLMKLAKDLVNKASMTNDGSKITMALLESGIKAMEDLNKEKGLEMAINNATQTVPEQGPIKDPSKVKTKGSGLQTRYKTAKEKGYQKNTERKCGRCGKMEGHNSRKCPNKPSCTTE